MKLILSYFNPVQGPIIFKSLPNDIPASDAKTLLGLMDIQNEQSIFEFNSYSEAKRGYTNFIMKIPSEWARGGSESIMLSIQSDRPEQLSFIHYNINRLAEKIEKTPNIYKAFYIANKHEDNEIELQYQKLMKILEKTYKILTTKHEELVIVDRLFQQEGLTDNESAAKIIQTLARTFITVIDARVPEGAVLLFDVGSVLADKYEGFFRSTELDVLLDEISRFWKKYAFGEIDDLIVDTNNLEFCVYDCFECSHFPDVNQTVCKFDEGFLTGLLTRKIQDKQISIEEIECYATGYDHCKFKVNILDRTNDACIKM